MNDDEIICTCLNISRRELIKAIKENSLKTFEEVGEATEAGTVCGQCEDEIQELLDELND